MASVYTKSVWRSVKKKPSFALVQPNILQLKFFSGTSSTKHWKLRRLLLVFIYYFFIGGSVSPLKLPKRRTSDENRTQCWETPLGIPRRRTSEEAVHHSKLGEAWGQMQGFDSSFSTSKNESNISIISVLYGSCLVSL